MANAAAGRTLAYLILAVSACAPAEGRDDRSTEADVAALGRIREQMEAAENAGNADGMTFAFADDLVIMPMGAPAVTGLEASRTLMQEYFRTWHAEIHYVSQEVVVDHDWAFDRGTYRQTLTPKAGGATVAEAGKYLWLYRRQEDGGWKAARVIWNPDGPAPSAP